MVLETNMKLCVTESDFLEEFFLPKDWENGPKTCFFLVNWKIWSFLLNLFYNEHLYWLLCSCTNTIFGKIFVPEIWAKCSQPITLQNFLINYISRTNQWKSLIFLHVDTNAYKLKVNQNFLNGHDQKWAFPVWSWDSKSDCISRTNW